MLKEKQETGRSMVEMLGVLAIIGVLSVGGVYGYGVAMKKHKANELLHQASMLATTISAQAMTNDGNLPLTITSFGNSNYGTFSPSTTDALDGKGFSIEISNMDSAVCTQMEKMTGGMVQGASCSGTRLTLTYYKNLATNDEEGKNSPTGGSDKENSCTLTAEDCASGELASEGCACAPATSNQTCTSYDTNQCGPNYYCLFDNPSYSENSTDSITDHGTGVCTPISGGEKIGGHWTVNELNWWSGNSWCLGKGSSGIITAATLQNEYGCKGLHDCNWEALRSAGIAGLFWVGLAWGGVPEIIHTYAETGTGVNFSSTCTVLCD